jgi:hypothetical protein
MVPLGISDEQRIRNQSIRRTGLKVMASERRLVRSNPPGLSKARSPLGHGQSLHHLAETVTGKPRARGLDTVLVTFARSFLGCLYRPPGCVKPLPVTIRQGADLHRNRYRPERREPVSAAHLVGDVTEIITEATTDRASAKS